MSATHTQAHEKEIHDAEELLFTGPQRQGFAKGLFFGRWMVHYSRRRYVQ